MDRLTAMESFVRTVERGSFAAAAAGRGLSASMVGNHVRFLEARLGVSLLVRSTRRQNLTEFGRDFYEECRRILQDIDAAERLADGARTTPRGLLRVTAPTSLGATVLPRVVSAYLRRHPDVRVELVLRETRLDLLGEGIDVAIRVGALPDSGLIARRLAPLRLVACASPDYLDLHGRPERPEDLRAHNCLDFTQAGEPSLWRFSDARGGVAVDVAGTLSANSGSALRAAALDHLGIVLQPDVVVAEDVAAGRLERILAAYDTPMLPVHLLTVPDRHAAAKIRQFVALAREMLGSAGAASSGHGAKVARAGREIGTGRAGS